MARPPKYSPELRERAVRMVLDHTADHPSQWAAIRSVGEKLGCSVEALRRWVRQAERDAGQRPGLTTSERDELKRLQRENSNSNAPTRFSAKRRRFSPRRSSTAERDDGCVYRRAARRVRGRADLPGIADRPVDLFSAQVAPRGSDTTRGPGAAGR
jgi:transposase